jgi:outer membrane lipoprotein-sorting protein
MIVLAAWMGMFFLTSLPALSSQAVEKRQSAAAADLDSLLKKMADYCRKLENAALDFICREEVAEKIDPSLDARAQSPLAGSWSWMSGGLLGQISRRPLIIKTNYVYDYQCVRKERAIRETRILLEENKKKKNEPNATLKTSNFVYGTPLLGPVGLFGERFQPDYDYKIVGQDKIDRRPVIVIDAKPKADSPDAKNLYGKAWIDPATADILKIEWSEKRVGGYEIFEKRGESYKLKPRITIRSEFSAEKNGIRFPSKLSIEEAYVNERGRAVVRSETTVTYKDFKFFTVEVEIK